MKTLKPHSAKRIHPSSRLRDYGGQVAHSDPKRRTFSPPTRPGKKGLVRDTECTEEGLFFENREMSILEKTSGLRPTKSFEQTPSCLSVPPRFVNHRDLRPDKRKNSLCDLCASVVKLSIFVLLVISLFPPAKSFGAETVKLRYLQSIYLDEKGVGMKRPEGIACNNKSLLIVADTGNNRLLQYTFQDKRIKGGKELKVSQISYPIRAEINSKGEIFALDSKQRRIVRMSAEGEFKDYVTVDSPGAFVPRSFKIDSTDQIYVLDIFSGRVAVLAPDGKSQRHIDFPKDQGFISDLAVDSKGTIFLLDTIKNMIFSATKGAKEFSPLTKSLKEYVNFPTSITTDGRGMLYIVDENGSGVAIFGADGSFLGRQLSMGWNEGLLYYPSQMCINEKGEAFIADRGNSRVQIFNIVR